MLQFDGAMEHFTSWKTGLERGLNQEVILITYYPVQTTGAFFWVRRLDISTR